MTPVAPPHLGNDRSFTEAWADLVGAFLRHDRRTPDLLAVAIDQHPSEPMGPIVKGWMLLMLARRELRAGAIEALAEGRRRLAAAPDVRAELYAEGLESWLAGDPRGAVRAMEQVIGDNPLDAMAVKLSHAVRFMLGDADGMRRSLSRVVSIYTDGVPYAGFIKGCFAFALEETGAYAEAEAMGRRAVELEPADAWGRHAVAHVHEMTGRADEGLAWLADAAAWSHCNNFGYHLHWHAALFQLELGRAGEALRLYDQAIRAERTDDYRDVANAASLLQRLELDGHDVGDRWDELAAIAERRVEDRQLAFADLHYLLALLGAGRFGSAEILVRGLLCAGPDCHNGELSGEIGAPLAAGLVAFRAGRCAEAVSLLEPVRRRLQAIGGSHAQRDVFEQIYLEALVRAGAGHCAGSLAERRAMRGGRDRFAERRLSGRLGQTGRGQLAAIALSLTPPPRAH
jgi:tetratricopeptide (TPR) repeat protein